MWALGVMRSVDQAVRQQGTVCTLNPDPLYKYYYSLTYICQMKPFHVTALHLNISCVQILFNKTWQLLHIIWQFRNEDQITVLIPRLVFCLPTVTSAELSASIVCVLCVFVSDVVVRQLCINWIVQYVGAAEGGKCILCQLLYVVAFRILAVRISLVNMYTTRH